MTDYNDDARGILGKYKSREITLYQSFLMMRKFVQQFWERGGKKSEEMEFLLSTTLCDESPDGLPQDIAQWNDWVKIFEEMKELR